MPEPTYAEFMKKADLVTKAVTANLDQLAFLAGHRDRMELVITKVRELTVQQANLTASKQDVSKQLEELVDEGRKLLTFLRAAVKQYFGNRSEKLVEFGQQPFRSKPRTKAASPDAQPADNEPTAASPNP